MSNIDLLKKYSKLTNIAPELEGKLDEDGKEWLKKIGEDVYKEFEDDKRSRSEWEDMIDQAKELAELKHEPKDYPWPGASNLKHPAIATAVIQFAAYTHPEIVRNDRVVEAAVIGYDYDGSKAEKSSRVCKFMNYQLLCEDQQWEQDLDKLLQMLPMQGIVYKKIYYDFKKQKNISELCSYKEVYVNHNIKSLKDSSCRRISHKMIKHKNEILSNMRMGYYSEIDLDEKSSEERSTVDSDFIGKDEFEIIEQHRYLDLDEDGYEEPYTVVILSETKDVLRIVARYNPDGIKTNKKNKVYDIEPIHYFVDYHYLRSFDGSYHSLSIASLLFSFTKGINATLNMLLNAGALATTQGGFLGRGARIRGGKIYLEPGEWIKLDSSSGDDIKKNIMPLEYKEPSNVLFQLLGFLTDNAKSIANITDVMTGDQNAQNVQATTIQILAEKGLKVFSAIQRRLHSSFTEEFSMLFQLNKKYLSDEKYKKVLDYKELELPLKQIDFDDEDYDIVPVANPNLSSDIQRLTRAQSELELLQIPSIGNNTKAVREILKAYLEAINSTNIDIKLPSAEPENSGPNPETIEIQGKLMDMAGKQDIEQKKHNLDVQKFMLEAEKTKAEIEKMRADAISKLVEAESTSVNDSFAYREQQLRELDSVTQTNLAIDKQRLEREKMSHDMSKHNSTMQADAWKTKSQQDHDSNLAQKQQQHDASQTQQQYQHEAGQTQRQQQFESNNLDNERNYEAGREKLARQHEHYQNTFARQHESSQAQKQMQHETSQNQVNHEYEQQQLRQQQQHEGFLSQLQSKQEQALETLKGRNKRLEKPSSKSGSSSKPRQP